MKDQGPFALIVNAGSSSLKTAVANRMGIVARHSVDRLDGSIASYADALSTCLVALDVENGVNVVGHRIVHGGTRFSRPVLVNDEVQASLADLVSLAPLHQPPGLAAMTATRQRFPNLPQVACFDTGFHSTMSELNSRFAIPLSLHDDGVRRYGFHGLSYEFVSGELRNSFPDVAKGRVVIAHLGSGASLCGLVEGRSVTTTMGMTPLDGLPMATRPGRIDPGVLLHLLRGPTAAGDSYSLDRLDELLNRESGLLGLSGISGDVRDLSASPDPAASFALRFFVAAVAREVAGVASDIGGLDALVFTAGIGENSSMIRADVVERLAWIGLRVDTTLNNGVGRSASVEGSVTHRSVTHRSVTQRSVTEIHKAGSTAAVFVIPTDEAAVIATHALSVLAPEEKL